ncbi:methyl-accepting chemotaxis protein [Lutibaculum baratangense]|uniref:Putative methyl-accepting chemotaxis protein n=1 Tax=Lutibaculum baratangense AMV1 TaxID=631454 RepID=V4RSK9_9HYPH|nr:methyl-accepting chemotaxis protein [Lutibaculum baratangense]ESR26120.1 putative methyl-accepting chemotaxis protein [Lutibaculum baratangense AMV1]
MRLTIPRKLAILIATSAVLTTAAMAVQLYGLKNRIWADREEMLVAQVDSAIAIMEGFAAQAEAGSVSLPEAQKRASDAIRAIRYNGSDYSWILDYQGLMLVHPREGREGNQTWDDQDPNGFHHTRSIVAEARAGGGFTPYVWTRLKGSETSPKLAYSEAYEPWQWVVATGVYVDDLEAIFWRELYVSLGWLVAILVALGACAWPIARSITRPLSQMSGVMRELAGGHNEVEVPFVGRRDEIGEMADTVQSFKLAALEKERLEGEAGTMREREESERNHRAAEAQAKAGDLRSFVAEIEKGFGRLSQGDLTVRLDRPVAPEYEAIRGQFNSSVSALEETIGSVVNAVGSIRSGLSEITSASNDLSQRTEQQAANLEETVAALGQVTGAVNETAAGADEAQTAAHTALGNAEKGGDIVGRAVSAMSEIERSSDEIAKIIGVIDEIAFQTNLLALNAGVEAARAGEAGKGFAVVAQEVRALAQRSAEAAKEIKDLIQTSNGQVRTGVELVSATGKSLSEIVAQVARMSDLVTDIAGKAKDQAVSLREVATAADQMDKVTQQNAAMVEEATAAAATLARETDDLAASVARFRTSAARARAGKPAPAAAPSRGQASKRPVPQLRPVAQTAPAVEEEGWEEF